MGGGGTLVQGIRRLFKRRASSPASDDHNHNNVNANNSRVLVRDLRAQLASIPNTLHPDSDSDFDFDFSTLKPIKVPTPIPFRPSSMDHHKKVLLFLFLFLLIAPSPLCFLMRSASTIFSFILSLIGYCSSFVFFHTHILIFFVWLFYRLLGPFGCILLSL